MRRSLVARQRPQRCPSCSVALLSAAQRHPAWTHTGPAPLCVAPPNASTAAAGACTSVHSCGVLRGEPSPPGRWPTPGLRHHCGRPFPAAGQAAPPIQIHAYRSCRTEPSQHLPRRRNPYYPAAAHPGAAAGAATQAPATGAGPDGDALQLPYLGPAPDPITAMDMLAAVGSFAQLRAFLDANGHYFRGPEVAVVVLQAANVAGLAEQRRVAAAMEVADRRAAAVEAAAAAGEEGRGKGPSPDDMAGAIDDWLAAADAATPPAAAAAPSSGSGGGDDESSSVSGGRVVGEMEAADDVAARVLPLLRAHIKRYPPSAMGALVTALADLNAYDQRLMELVAEAFRADPRVWLARASAGAAHGSDAALAGAFASNGGSQPGAGGGGGAVDLAIAYGGRYAGLAPVGSSSTGGGGGDEGEQDPWVALVSLACGFARLGHYDPQFMKAVAAEAAAMMPYLAERADALDYEAEAAAAEAAEAAAAQAAAAGKQARQGGADGARGSADVDADAYAAAAAAAAAQAVYRGGPTDSVVALLCAFHEMCQLEPLLMQAAGEHLASFPHQLDAAALCETLLAFASFNARNPPFYRLMLRALLLAPTEGLTPRAAGALYRACVLMAAMGDVGPLTPAAWRRPPPDGAAADADTVTEAEEDAALAAGLRALLRGCGAGFPHMELRATALGRPSPQQLADASEELRAAWEATGLMTVPQVLACLYEMPVELWPPEEVTEASAAVAIAAAEAAAAARANGADDAAAAEAADAAAAAAAQAADGDGDGPLVGGTDAPLWVPPDALVLYDNGDGTVTRIAVKAIDDALHCCRNVAVSAAAAALSASDAAQAASDAAAPPPPELRLRLRGPALSEVRCLESWGWRVLVVPVGVWRQLDFDGQAQWLERRLHEVAGAGAGAATGDGVAAGGAMGPEVPV